MVATADLSRSGFMNGDISTVMSPRTVLTWAENYLIFDDSESASALIYVKLFFILSMLGSVKLIKFPSIDEFSLVKLISTRLLLLIDFVVAVSDFLNSSKISSFFNIRYLCI
jgi:hypothetical protein